MLLVCKRAYKQDERVTMDPLNDTILEIKQRYFHVDRSLLAAQSKYFDVLFYGGFKESTQHIIHLHGVDEECFQTLLDYINKGNLVIVTGGYFRGDFVWYSIDWVIIYDSCQNSWVDGPPMKMSRNCHCAVGVGHCLYAIGGSTDESVIADVESLDLTNMQWETRSPLIRPVERAAATSAGTNLYVLCGRDENGDVYSGVQRFNTQTDEWVVISYSPLPRYDLCATTLNGVIYTIGGKALRFDLDSEEWFIVDKDCLNRKFFMGCASVNGRIYILGQRRASITQDIPSFILLDPYLDNCQVIDNNITCPLPIRGCVTVKSCDVWS